MSYGPVTSSAKSCKEVTPSDANDLETQFGTDFKMARGLYIGSGGDVEIVTPDGDEVTFVAVAVGILPVYCIQVKAAATTADDIVALY